MKHMVSLLLIPVVLSFAFNAHASRRHQASDADAANEGLQDPTSIVLDCEGLVIELAHGTVAVNGEIDGKVLHANKKTGTYIIEFIDRKRNVTSAPMVCGEVVAPRK